MSELPEFRFESDTARLIAAAVEAALDCRPSSPPAFVDAATAAALAGVHVATWRRWVRTGFAPAPRRLGTKLHRWATAEILAFLDGLPRAPVG
jgi:predicted DNA-binding transcriptional regulator AlpA